MDMRTKSEDTERSSQVGDERAIQQPCEAKGERSGVIITQLAEMPPKTLLDEGALAEVLRVTKRTVRRMVSRYELPPGILFGGRKRWQAGKILEYFEAEAERLAKEAEKRARKFRNLH